MNRRISALAQLLTDNQNTDVVIKKNDERLELTLGTKTSKAKYWCFSSNGNDDNAISELARAARTKAPHGQIVIQNTQHFTNAGTHSSGYQNHKNKFVAAIAAMFLGGIGIHKFYMGKNTAGLFYLLFFWTAIPAVIGFIEGIIYLCESQEAFNRRFRKP